MYPISNHMKFYLINLCLSCKNRDLHHLKCLDARSSLLVLRTYSLVYMKALLLQRENIFQQILYQQIITIINIIIALVFKKKAYYVENSKHINYHYNYFEHIEVSRSLSHCLKVT
jgi:hypothetical protein